MMPLSNDNQTRYSRHLSLEEIGEEGQLKINKARVLIVGAGGLGSPVIQYLVAAGVGQLCIIDDDNVELSNLQRQVIFHEKSQGLSKAHVAAVQALKLNSQPRVIPIQERLTFERALTLFKSYDVIVDGTDNYDTRYLINDAAVIKGKPVVSGAVFKFEGQLTVYNYNSGPTYRCLFPDEDNLGFGCSETGVVGPMVGIIGTHMAMEVLKVILGIGHIATGELIVLNGLTNDTLTLKYEKNPSMIAKARSRKGKHKKEVSYG